MAINNRAKQWLIVPVNEASQINNNWLATKQSRRVNKQVAKKKKKLRCAKFFVTLLRKDRQAVMFGMG